MCHAPVCGWRAKVTCRLPRFRSFIGAPDIPLRDQRYSPTASSLTLDGAPAIMWKTNLSPPGRKQGSAARAPVGRGAGRSRSCPVAKSKRWRWPGGSKPKRRLSRYRATFHPEGREPAPDSGHRHLPPIRTSIVRPKKTQRRRNPQTKTERRRTRSPAASATPFHRAAAASGIISRSYYPSAVRTESVVGGSGKFETTGQGTGRRAA